ncbi:MAG: pantetheine-phosphate adenylyltransferase [Waddliaceae bacterium]
MASSTVQKRVLFPGSFDPPSLGHCDIIQRASNMCHQLYVGIAVNVEKSDRLFSIEERVEMLTTATDSFSNVEVAALPGLAVDFALQNTLDFIVRGIRPFSNMEREFQMALANRKMSGIETMFLLADPKLSHISCSLIREIGKLGHRLGDFVPEFLEESIFQRLLKKREFDVRQ